MKNLIRKSKRQKAVAILAGVFTLLLVSFASFANNGGRAHEEGNYTVKYVGESANGLVFNLKYQNPDAVKFEVVLKNQDGSVLFQKAFSEKELDRNIVLGKDVDTENVSFIVKTSKGNLIQNFKIKTKTVQVVDVQAEN